MKIFLLAIIIITQISCTTKNSLQSFSNKLATLENLYGCKIGVSAKLIEKDQSLNYRDDEKFFMASTVKIPIAIYLLHLAEIDPKSLNRMIEINPYDLAPGSGYLGYFMSRPGLKISIYNLLEPMLAISDNTANDIILKNVGGTKAVYNFLSKHNLSDILVSRTMLQLYIDSNDLKYIPKKEFLNLSNWQKLFKIKSSRMEEIYWQFDQDIRDTTTPYAMTNLLIKLVKYEILNEKTSDLLIDILKRAKVAPNRIRKSLPKDFLLANKSGSFWNYEGSITKFTYASDVGIVIMPNGLHIALSIFVKSNNGQTTIKLQEVIIAEIAKIIFNDLRA